MNRVRVLLACGLLSVTLASYAGAQAHAPAAPQKPREFSTAQSPALSPPLTAAQRAKLAERPTAPPLATSSQPATGVKFPSVSTSEPASATAHSQPIPRRWSPRLDRAGVPVHKDADRQTALAPDAKLDAARASEIARKPFTSKRPGAAGTAPKLAPFETRGPASPADPAALKAKLAQADSLAARRPQ
jgi:hypothetical protein